MRAMIVCGVRRCGCSDGQKTSAKTVNTGTILTSISILLIVALNIVSLFVPPSPYDSILTLPKGTYGVVFPKDCVILASTLAISLQILRRRRK